MNKGLFVRRFCFWVETLVCRCSGLKFFNQVTSGLYVFDITRLLRPDDELQYSLRPSLLAEQVEKLKAGDWVVIDEAHRLIEDKKIRFPLSGSNSRKLKRGGANLLEGRAFVDSMHPLTFEELGREFNLNSVLTWGTLPRILSFSTDDDKARDLRAYTQTYAK